MKLIKSWFDQIVNKFKKPVVPTLALVEQKPTLDDLPWSLGFSAFPELTIEDFIAANSKMKQMPSKSRPETCPVTGTGFYDEYRLEHPEKLDDKTIFEISRIVNLKFQTWGYDCDSIFSDDFLDYVCDGQSDVLTEAEATGRALQHILTITNYVISQEACV